MKRIGITGRAGAGKDALAAHLIGLHGGYKIALADALKRMCREVFNCQNDSLFGDSIRRNDPVPMRSFESWRATAMHRFHAIYEATNHRAGWDGFELMHYVVEKHFATRYAASRPVTTYGPSGQTVTMRQGGMEITTRFVLQIVGTEWGRELDENMWVKELDRVADRVDLRRSSGYSPEYGLCSYDPRSRITDESVIVTPDVRYANEADAIRDAGGIVYYVDAERRLGPRTDAHRSEPSPEAMRDMADLVIDNNGTMDFAASIRHAARTRTSLR